MRARSSLSHGYIERLFHVNEAKKMARVIDGRLLPTFLHASPTKETNPTWEMIMKNNII